MGIQYIDLEATKQTLEVSVKNADSKVKATPKKQRKFTKK